jgi:hypothetical protein
MASSGTTKFASFSAGKKTKLNALFDVALQDSNGKNVYSSTKVHLGHLDPKKNLVVHDAVWNHAKISTNYDVDLIDFGEVNGHLAFLGANGDAYRRTAPFLLKSDVLTTKEEDQAAFWHMVIMNYRKLVESGIDAKASAYAALFRSRWAFTGALAFLAQSKVDPSSEVTFITSNDATYSNMLKQTTMETIFDNCNVDIDGLYDVLEDDEGGLEWVLMTSENMWAAVEHTFRVRSHHFKSTGEDATAYKRLYETFMNACYEGEFALPDGFDWFTIAHTAIHPFKIEALPKTTAHYLSHGMIADAAKVRLSGAPVGNAVLTTTYAAMSTMASEIWYSSFKRIYQDDLNELKSVTKQICNNKYSYHIAAGLYGLDKLESVEMSGETVTTSDARTKLSVLGAAAAGLMDALSEAKQKIPDFKFALSNAKALRKASSNNPLMNLKVRELVLRAVSEVADAESLPEAIEASLPGTNALLRTASNPG